MTVRYDDNVSVKMVMVGDSGVGKTSLANRWTAGYFQDGQTPTVGSISSLRHLSYGDTEIDVFLWDTAGQEDYTALVPLYIRQASVCILVISVDDLDSWDSVGKWLDIISNSCPDSPPVFLAVNKTDLSDPTNEKLATLERLYPGALSRTFFVSAKTGMNVNDMFQHAGESGYEHLISQKSSTKSDEPVKLVINESLSGSGGCC